MYKTNEVDNNHHKRWLFTLELRNSTNINDIGQDLALVAMNREWQMDANLIGLSQLTDPAIVWDFLNRYPILQEKAHKDPFLIALYAPQLTIHGYEGSFGGAFDTMMEPHCEIAYSDNIDFSISSLRESSYDDTICGDLLAFRHDRIGGFKPEVLAVQFMTATKLGFSRRSPLGFDIVIWLLSEKSNWLPAHIRKALIDGYREEAFLWFYEKGFLDNSETEKELWINWNFVASMFPVGDIPNFLGGSEYGLSMDGWENESYTTREMTSDEARAALISAVERVVTRIGATETPDQLIDRFIRHGFDSAPSEYMRKRQSRK